MRLTKKSKYAARAVVENASIGRGSPIGAAEITRRQSIPERFLEQIFGELRRADVLGSRRGAHGGYCLALPGEEVTVLDIVEILDGAISPARYSDGAIATETTRRRARRARYGTRRARRSKSSSAATASPNSPRPSAGAAKCARGLRPVDSMRRRAVGRRCTERSFTASSKGPTFLLGRETSRAPVVL